MPHYITRQRKNEIKDVVIGIFEKCCICSLPVKLGTITKTYGIRCLKMDAVAARTSSASASKDGYTIKSGSGYIIMYNPSQISARIRFTVACQLAHIFLGHLNRGISNEQTDAEATYFARELLMPLSVLDSYGCRSAGDIAARCGVSLAAAQIRSRDFIRRDRYKRLNGETDYDMRFLNCFFGGGHAE